jgi:hypothetical protein
VRAAEVAPPGGAHPVGRVQAMLVDLLAHGVSTALAQKKAGKT